MTDQDIPVWRLNLLRAFYLLITVGLAINWGPTMLQLTDLWAQRRGELGAMLSGLAILMGMVLTPLVLPWRYIAHHYFRKPAQAWR